MTTEAMTETTMLLSFSPRCQLRVSCGILALYIQHVYNTWLTECCTDKSSVTFPSACLEQRNQLGGRGRERGESSTLGGGRGWGDGGGGGAWCNDKRTMLLSSPVRAQELWKSRGGHPGFPVPNSPCGFCGRKATQNLKNRLQSRRGDS